MTEPNRPDFVIDPTRFRRHGEPVLLVNEADAARLRELDIPDVIVSPFVPAGYMIAGQRPRFPWTKDAPPAEQPGE